jgi:hypothetical protein
MSDLKRWANMKTILLLSLLLCPGLFATSYNEPPPHPIESGKYKLLTHRKDDTKDPQVEIIESFEIKKDKEGNLIIDFGYIAETRITQEKNHFVITKSQTSGGTHWITTYVGSLSSEINPVVYRGKYVLISYRNTDSHWVISTSEGTFAIEDTLK